MTMTTCHPEYGNSERYIVHLRFESWTPKDTGVPQELADEPAS
jgi:sortase A